MDGEDLDRTLDVPGDERLEGLRVLPHDPVGVLVVGGGDALPDELRLTVQVGDDGEQRGVAGERRDPQVEVVLLRAAGERLEQVPSRGRVDLQPAQLLKGVLDLAVLAVVAQEDGYGYDVVRRLRAAGIEEVGDASVYGTLRRLYASGALTSYVVPSDEGPHRKYYGINPQGRAMLAAQRKDWHEFAGTLDRLLRTEGAA